MKLFAQFNNAVLKCRTVFGGFVSGKRWIVTAAAITILLTGPSSDAQDVSTMLTDKVFKGSGTIDLLQDISSSSLSSYFDANGSLKLGVDINDNVSGNETSTSIGTAIKYAELVIVTDTGTFTFSDLYTTTSAMIQESGAESASQFSTLFGQTGSSQLTSATEGFDLASYDDVLEIQNISITGTIQSASLNLTFLKTESNGGENEEFFDFGGGFEDFAVLSSTDASTLSAAQIGQTDVSSGVSFTSNSNSDPSAPPGGPVPPVSILAMAGILLLFKRSRSGAA